MYVNIKKGSHRNQEIVGIFPVVKPWKEGARGGQITIKTGKVSPFLVDDARVKVEEEDYEYCTKDGVLVDPSEFAHANDVAARVAEATKDQTDYASALALVETDEEAMNRIKETFDIYSEMVDTCAEGVTRGLVVSGPPGIGKSFECEAKLEEANLFRTIKDSTPWYEVIGGVATPISLYKKLYNNRFPGFVTVFDDCDNILYDESSLNLLKAALDSKKTRNLSWLAESRTLREEEIPGTFAFEGSVIFLTNTKFDRARGKIADHLEAIVSRCHYMDLSIDSQRDQLLRIKQIVREGMLNSYDFENDEETTIVEYIESNAVYMRELSLRMVKKIADLVKSKPNGWERLARETCMVRQARFKKLMEARED